jgi:hypothetical protein
MSQATHYCCPQCGYVPADRTRLTGATAHRHCCACNSLVDPHPIYPATIPAIEAASFNAWAENYRIRHYRADPDECTYEPLPQPLPAI